MNIGNTGLLSSGILLVQILGKTTQLLLVSRSGKITIISEYS